jgi:hypothetical protein
MIRLTVALIFLIGTADAALSAECANGRNFAGCVGQNGAAVYNKNTGTLRGGQYGSQYYHKQEDWHRLYTIPGCAWVDGRRVCR